MNKQKQLAQFGQMAVVYYNIWHLQASVALYQYPIYDQFRPYQTWADIITKDIGP